MNFLFILLQYIPLFLKAIISNQRFKSIKKLIKCSVDICGWGQADPVRLIAISLAKIQSTGLKSFWGNEHEKVA